MFYRRNWITVIVVIFVLIMFMPNAQAQRQEFETIQCLSGTTSRVHSTPELAIATWDFKGIVQSTHESKLFDNWTRHSVLVLKREGDKLSWNGFTKAQAPDGEFIIWEFSKASEGETVVKAISGSGKWKGVKGEYTTKRITRGKPVAPDTDQYCEQVKGWIELHK
jgi:secreted Zn-dependent insulinase-like peptidase